MSLNINACRYKFEKEIVLILSFVFFVVFLWCLSSRTCAVFFFFNKGGILYLSMF